MLKYLIELNKKLVLYTNANGSIICHGYSGTTKCPSMEEKGNGDWKVAVHWCGFFLGVLELKCRVGLISLLIVC
jgi:hypothetical protein